MNFALAEISSPRIGVALGGGAARGLSHIPYIEAMDEMGLYPAAIAGTSIGALIGAGWARGMTGKELREHATTVLGSFQLIAGTVLSAHRPSLIGMVQNGLSFQVDAESITGAFLPDGFPDAFSALRIPFSTVATDFYTWEQVVFREGSLRLAIAASMAIPAAFKPVRIEGATYIDGGVVNPVPLDLVAATSDILIGIDVNGTAMTPQDDQIPGMVDTGFVATQIMIDTIVRNMMERYPPDIYVQPSINAFGLLEFWRVKELLDAAEPDKDRFKRALEAKLEEFSRG
ncbi:patatin-like phospholipase family protein [Pelagibacterium montanilacus]|uniref:patatin-like phospholipase family protein n=1 Tax=Pelagibacterium montanilacus TaxID=2185280 RepID=UPI000F8EC435|nr:patatin-like phospholipase family protein [Pelagibacterium montanilacus]